MPSGQTHRHTHIHIPTRKPKQFQETRCTWPLVAHVWFKNDNIFSYIRKSLCSTQCSSGYNNTINFTLTSCKCIWFVLQLYTQFIIYNYKDYCPCKKGKYHILISKISANNLRHFFILYSANIRFRNSMNL